MIEFLRNTCKSIGEDRLGIVTSRVGTHSIRTSSTMQLYIAGVKDFIIMMMGRWKSLGFLKYIRPQIQEFSSELSTLMSSGSDLHFSIAHTRKNLVQTRLFCPEQRTLKKKNLSRTLCISVFHFIGSCLRGSADTIRTSLSSKSIHTLCWSQPKRNSPEVGWKLFPP